LPKLTAAAPLLTNGKEEHDSTILAEPGTQGHQLAAQAAQPALNRPSKPEPSLETATDRERPAHRAPELLPESRRVTRKLGEEPAPVSRPVEPVASAAAPARTRTISLLNPMPDPSNAKLIVALAAIVAVLLVGVVGVVVFKPAATGLLIITVPDDVATSASLTINGQNVLDDKGNPIREWPQVRLVPAGKVNVMVRAPGYEPLIETVTVLEGNEPTPLTKSLKKRPADETVAPLEPDGSTP
jgi:eukaryotic-like serine/threonine-protein kinase